MLTALVKPNDGGTDATAGTTNQPSSGQSAAEQADSPAVGSILDEAWYVSDLTVSPVDVQPAVQTTTTTTAAPRLPSTTLTASTTTTLAAVPASATIRFAMPTGGSVTCGFSGDELVFSATMCDWRVHNGVDISGEPGEEVRACADGTVEGFVEDMLYGNTAIIRHADDSVMYYCGLDDTQMVSAGLIVKAGDVIGYIGEVPCELADGAHIHLALMKDGQFIDPATVLPVS